MVVTFIPLFFPNDSNIKNIKRFSEQSDRVIVYDNSPVNNSTMFDDFTNVIYKSDLKNNGISVAFNSILKDSSFGFKDDDFIVFCDQDSEIENDHIGKLIEEYNKLCERGYNVGAIAPIFFDIKRNIEMFPKKIEQLDDLNASVSEIGILNIVIKYKTLKIIDFWNEGLFLDLTDYDISWRLRQSGYICVVTKASLLKGAIGSGQKKIGFLKLKVGSPFREYYQTRDCLYLLKEKYVPFKYRVRFIAMLTVRPVVHILFLDNKKQRLQYIIKGVKDYKNGITGELNEVYNLPLNE